MIHITIINAKSSTLLVRYIYANNYLQTAVFKKSSYPLFKFKKKNSHNIQRLVFSFMPEAVALGVKNSKSHKCKQSG